MKSIRILGALVLVAGLGACGEGNVFSLEPGTCFDDVDAFFDEEAEGVADVPTVDCAQPHDNEVFATFDLSDGAFPGVDEVQSQADAGCIERFETYVGSDYASSRFVSTYLVPTPGTWDDGDREVVCFLYDVDLAEIEGSAEGTGE